MVRKVSLSPRKPKSVIECFDCGKKLRGMPRVILVDVWGSEEAQEQKAQSKVKQRRWFCDYYCVQTFLARVTTTKVLPPQRG